MEIICHHNNLHNHRHTIAAAILQMIANQTCSLPNYLTHRGNCFNGKMFRKLKTVRNTGKTFFNCKLYSPQNSVNHKLYKPQIFPVFSELSLSPFDKLIERLGHFDFAPQFNLQTTFPTHLKPSNIRTDYQLNFRILKISLLFVHLFCSSIFLDGQ